MTDSVLVADEDAALRAALSGALKAAGYRARGVADGAAALAGLDCDRPGVLVCDVSVHRTGALELLAAARARRADLPVVLMTAYGSIAQAVAATRAGAAEYLVKPFDPQALVGVVGRLLGQAVPDDAPIAGDPRTREIYALAARVAASDATVLISGASGTGKEVLARHIHRRSARAAQPFVAINCAAIPDNMLEALLFGYERGAFTGAAQAHPGKFEQAQGGTLLLDEVSELPLGLQAKLLRVLQEREVERLGARRALRLDVRVLATTNRDLGAAVAAGSFREDLYYRLNVFPLHLPALAQRLADVPELAAHLLARHAGARPVRLETDALARLCGHRWPGNVRELDNVIQRALILSGGGSVGAAHILFQDIPGSVVPAPVPAPLADDLPLLGREVRGHEAQLILAALSASRGRREAAATRLGISPRTLRYKLAQLRAAGVAVPQPAGA